MKIVDGEDGEHYGLVLSLNEMAYIYASIGKMSDAKAKAILNEKNLVFAPVGSDMYAALDNFFAERK